MNPAQPEGLAGDEARRVFYSHRHPGQVSSTFLYLRELVTPLFTCMLPVMILALLAVLSERDPLPYLIWGSPMAYLGSSGWVLFNLQKQIAEVHVQDSWAALRSAWDIASGSAFEWQPISQVKRTHQGMLVSAGADVVELYEEDWPDFESLKAALRQASGQGNTIII